MPEHAAPDEPSDAAVDAFIDDLRSGLRDRLRHRAFGTEWATAVRSSDQRAWMVEAMLDALPTKHPFDDLGPFYDTAGLLRWLKVSRQAVSKKIQRRAILALTTGNGARVYPAWQFTPDGQPLAGLPEVLDELLSATDPWTAAVWLTTPVERLGGRTAIEVLRASQVDPRPAGEARELAAEDARRWRQ